MRKIARTDEIQVKRVNLNIPLELHNSFKSLTAAQGQTMSDVLLAYIQQYVADHTTPKPKGRRK